MFCNDYVFDALSSSRYYKEPMPLKQCFEIKKNDAGQEFDPFLVDIFLQNRRRIEKICEENNNKKELFRKQEKIDLSFIEFEILHLLMRSPGRMFSKEQIYDIIWNEPYSGDYNVVMRHICNIREKKTNVSEVSVTFGCYTENEGV